MEDVDLFQDKVFSVGEISRLVHDVLEGTFRRVSVEGEVTSFTRAASGHSYFALTDRDARGGTLRLDCAVFKWSRLGRDLDLSNGQKVIASGKVSSWGGSSRYQLIVDSVRESGTGDLLRRLEELKKKLSDEGLFSPERKRPLPFMPRRVGVVTSLQGAAVRDIVRTLFSNFPVPVLVFPSKVQGEGAAAQVAEGIAALNRVRDVDVIIIGRGGGSLEDLWAFNDEALVRAVAASRVPLVSAVGHEVDHLLTDEAADARAATPTAAGQMVVPSLEGLRADMAALRDRLVSGLQRSAENAGQRLDDAQARLAGTGLHLLAEPRHRVEVARARLTSRHPRRLIEDERQRFDQAARRLQSTGERLLEPAVATLNALGLRLAPMSPFAPLERGYALARRTDGRVINRFDQVASGDHIDVMLGKGALDCRVDDVRKDRDRSG